MRIDLRRAKRCLRCTKTTIGWRLYGTDVEARVVGELREHRHVGAVVDQLPASTTSELPTRTDTSRPDSAD